MTPTFTVIGSGASGVHFALSVLRKGCAVRMLDVARQGSAAVLPDATLDDLKRQLPDPAEYFLGPRFESALLPGASDEYYGIPPSKDYVFDRPVSFRPSSSGFAPLFSFAQGGLGEVWTGGCYPWNQEEIADYPFGYADLAPHYAEVARRIGISGADDDLSRFMPLHDHLLPPLRLDPHSERLIASYARGRDRLNRSGAYVGRSRVATLSQPLRARKECTYTGRCLWGCPRSALYTPSQTLQECLAHERFEYIPGAEVSHLRLGPGGQVRSIVYRLEGTATDLVFEADRVALAAGALLSTRIFLMTLLRANGERARLHGLMDNRQVLVPFVNFGMLGQPFVAETYQYHLLGLGLETPSARDYVHGQITTLKTALVHPLVQRMPLNLGASTRVFRALHAALGLVNVNFRDTRRAENYVELGPGDAPDLHIHYQPELNEPARVRATLARVKRLLWVLNCAAVPGMTHVRPMGASVHYAGTVPMTGESAPYTTTSTGESRDIPKLFLVDGATFPFLPAKNITFTLMANAVRIADYVCG